MKKGFLFLAQIVFFASFFCFASDSQYSYPAVQASKLKGGLPEELIGIWEGKDRYVFFEEAQEDADSLSPVRAQLVIVLKEYYGWYLDRAAEPSDYAQKETRTRNTGTTRNAEHIYITADYLYPEYPENHCYNMLLSFSKFQRRIVPFTVLDDGIYLDFFVKLPQDKEVYEPSFDGLYIGNHLSTGFTLSDESDDENIGCLYVADDSMYDIRYWKTDMEFQSDGVTFTYGDSSFVVPRHVVSGEVNYSCVSGRSRKIRNPMPPVLFSPEDYVFNADRTVLIADKAPYLTKLAGKDDFYALMDLVRAANARRAPDRKSPFEPQELDWHWDIIDALEKDNQIIQQVRERQRAFGPRGRDTGMQAGYK